MALKIVRTERAQLASTFRNHKTLIDEGLAKWPAH